MIESSLTTTELLVRKKHERGISSQPGPLGKFAKAVARLLRNLPEALTRESGGRKVTRDLIECWELRREMARAGEEAKQRWEAVRTIAERTTDHDTASGTEDPMQFPSTGAAIGDVMEHV